MKISKTAVITIIGRPNVGKSTLANAIAGEKVAIVSHKPQTTRNRIYAVRNFEDTQLVFVDTPGFHKPKNQLGNYMVKVVRESVSDVEACLLVVEPIAHIGEQEEALLQYVRKAAEPVFLVINKIDTVKKEELLAVMATYSAAHTFDHIVPISAKTGEGVAMLEQLLCGYAIPGEALFPEDMVTDQPDRQIVRTVGAQYLLSVTAIWNFLPPALTRNRSGSTFFLRYHSHRHIQDLRRGTIVFFQRYEFKVTVFFLQLIKTFRICSPESVNRLIRIPDHKQFPSRRAPQFYQTELNRIDILKLIY